MPTFSKRQAAVILGTYRNIKPSTVTYEQYADTIWMFTRATAAEKLVYLFSLVAEDGHVSKDKITKLLYAGIDSIHVVGNKADINLGPLVDEVAGLDFVAFCAIDQELVDIITDEYFGIDDLASFSCFP